MRLLLSSILLGLCLILSSQAHARYDKATDSYDTDVKVTVKAHDAKFIGSGVGGAHIMIRDKLTGDIIAEGTTSGGTGNTDLIMADPQARHAIIVDDKTADFEFSISILKPTAVEITATAPLAQPQSAVTVTQDMILIPGKDYTSGNGIMLELSGFSVDIQTPTPNSSFKENDEDTIVITAHVMKLCGCKIDENSPWPPENYEVEAEIYIESTLMGSIPMTKTEQPGQYALKTKLDKIGTYTIAVTAFDPITKEGGVDFTTFTVTPAATKTNE